MECAPGELFIGIDKRIRVLLDSREVVLDGEDAPTTKEAVDFLPDQGTALVCTTLRRKDCEQPPSEPQAPGSRGVVRCNQVVELPEKTRRVTDASLMADLFGPKLWYEDKHPDAATKVALGGLPKSGGGWWR